MNRFVNFVSAFKAPHLPRMKTERHLLSDAELIEELRNFNGTPEILLKDKELMDMFLPIMRAEGDHFFVHSNRNELLHYMEKIFKSMLYQLNGRDDYNLSHRYGGVS